MSDKKATPPPLHTTRPPWMLTPPPSVEKLSRAVSDDPFKPPNPTTPSENEPGCSYFDHLHLITQPSYRDPPITSTSSPINGPLFLDSEEDDIQMGTDNRLVSFSSVRLTCRYCSKHLQPPLPTLSPSVLTRPTTTSNSPAPSFLRTESSILASR